jgi:hypothetical protein
MLNPDTKKFQLYKNITLEIRIITEYITENLKLALRFQYFIERSNGILLVAAVQDTLSLFFFITGDIQPLHVNVIKKF